MVKFSSKFHFQILWYSFTGDDWFLLTPFLISPRKILPPAPLDTSTTALLCIFSSILNSKIEGWKYRSRELLKAIFFPSKKKNKKNIKKADIFLKFAWNFFQTFAWNVSNQPSGQNQQDGKQTYCQLPLQFFKINFKDTPSHISMDYLLGVYILSRIFLNVFANLHIAPWLQKILKFMVLRLLENAFVSQKIQFVHFYLCPEAKISPRFLSLQLQAGGNFSFPPHVFCIFSQQKGRIMDLKKWPKLNLQGYCSQVLINFTI